MSTQQEIQGPGELQWFKSSYSGAQGGNCVEVAIEWCKSSYSGPQGGDCVEVAACSHTVHVRDSKDIARPSLAFEPGVWAAFVAYASA